ncbi:hypothetical protein IFM12275_56460 [Nocardia sputorum]|uniref:Resolvase/invertase-type recombinase catalytic domain-containing protein n=1 Tax=Nocardia sputorum TaxID=2984338 RepID=A0ABN6TX19_9NOCA|nr:hypothetical protein IFM12275_56460 [Nocardia sputorum]BDT97449.1 hypothetical protein IFM12276_04780 [Nocardia sputorum]
MRAAGVMPCPHGTPDAVSRERWRKPPAAGAPIEREVIMKPKVVGYLRRDISGRRARRHEMEIRALAKASGFDLARTLVAGPTAPASLTALLTVVVRVGAVAVLTPTLEHVEFRADEIMAVCALITLESRHFPPQGRASTPPRHGPSGPASAIG